MCRVGGFKTVGEGIVSERHSNAKFIEPKRELYNARDNERCQNEEGEEDRRVQR
jgi:hypothetical protein